jgi:FkbM family methyltransferase
MVGSTGKLASLVYNLLLRLELPLRSGRASRLWRWSWDKSCSVFSGPVTTSVHGQKVLLNFGYPYPLFARLYPRFNTPLLELVYQSSRVLGTPVTVVDVGAAIGDTVLLLYGNCAEMVGSFLCVEGDPEFFGYLGENLAHLKGQGKLVLGVLSSQEGTERDLVRIHRGTASSTGDKQVESTTLDTVLMNSGIRRVDVLKIDVDGFDGKVLLGSKQTLSTHRPAVIFEWHPILCENASNNWTDHFEALTDCGYTRFVWFTKYGDFSHFTSPYDRAGLDLLVALCLRNAFHDDWHYDVIALTPDNPVSELSLAEAAFARNRISPY